jgi:RND family efflux transporter MFP subunit
MKKVLVFLLIIALIGGGYFFFQQKRVKQNQVMMAVLAERNFYTVKRGSVTKSISGSGFINPIQEKELVFLASGRMGELKIEKGQRVEKDQLLATLDNVSEEFSLLKSKHTYEQAQISSNPASIKERELEYKIAQMNYENTFLYAPFSGLITDVYVAVGDQMGASKAVAHLIDDSRYFIELRIDELDISQIKIGLPVRITVDAIPRVTFIGEVTEIELVAVNQGGIVTIPVKAEMVNANPLVKPGMSATARVVLDEAKDVLVVPLTAVANGSDGAYVLKRVDGGTEPVKVVTGIADDTMIAVLEGLEEGDQIIINNYNQAGGMRNGMPMRPGAPSVSVRYR